MSLCECDQCNACYARRLEANPVGGCGEKMCASTDKFEYRCTFDPFFNQRYWDFHSNLHRCTC